MVLVFQDSVSLCSPVLKLIVDLVSLRLRGLSASASSVRIKDCAAAATTTTGLILFFLKTVLEMETRT